MKLKKLNSLACVAGMALTLWSVEARERTVPIGSQPEKLTFKDIHYLPRTLDDYGAAKGYVLAFTTTGCPLVERYLPRLKELSAQYRDKGVQFIAINVGPDDSLKDVAYQARTPEFWNSMDMIGGPKSYWLGGSFGDGKGEPAQSNSISHGCVPARFKQANIVNPSVKRNPPSNLPLQFLNGE